MDLYLYPGVEMNVTAPTKITMTPLAPGEVPPAGATIIPPQSALPSAVAMVRAAQEANTAVAEQAAIATEAIQQAASALNQSPPWSVTFTEKR